MENESMRPPQPADIAGIENDVAACVARLSAHPNISALLFTCADSHDPSHVRAKHMPDDACLKKGRGICEATLMLESVND
ncbi:hypothetical protein NKI56_35400 [Mesorhizobium sp. M0622]|uniref:hypothetical protein n=1 Tax=Mesorhizobium sp. M0622 TaxID=2956975 RepID=UPI00333B8B16